jgi:hypothetical protein
MVYRVLPLFLVALALAVFIGAPVLAEDKDKDDANKANTHEGKVVSVEGNKLIMVDKEGKNEHTHQVADDAQITCDGKKCSLEDLKKGMRVRVTTDKEKKVATRIEARKASED